MTRITRQMYVCVYVCWGCMPLYLLFVLYDAVYIHASVCTYYTQLHNPFFTSPPYYTVVVVFCFFVDTFIWTVEQQGKYKKCYIERKKKKWNTNQNNEERINNKLKLYNSKENWKKKQQTFTRKEKCNEQQQQLQLNYKNKGKANHSLQLHTAIVHSYITIKKNLPLSACVMLHLLLQPPTLHMDINNNYRMNLRWRFIQCKLFQSVTHSYGQTNTHPYIFLYCCCHCYCFPLSAVSVIV